MSQSANKPLQTSWIETSLAIPAWMVSLTATVGLSTVALRTSLYAAAHFQETINYQEALSNCLHMLQKKHCEDQLQGIIMPPIALATAMISGLLAYGSYKLTQYFWSKI